MTNNYSQVPEVAPCSGAFVGSHPSVDDIATARHHFTKSSSASSYADLAYLFGVQDPAMIAAKGGRVRRKSAQEGDHVKHRRTRSGCYTCRSRRVKCDENLPICERCKKGGRECAYPEPGKRSRKPGSRSSTTGAVANKDETVLSSNDDDEEDDSERLESIMDEDEDTQDGTGSQTSPQTISRRPSSLLIGMRKLSSTKIPSESGYESPSLKHSTSPSPTLPARASGRRSSLQRSLSRDDPASEKPRKDWSHLPRDLRYYLNYFCENVTYHHYALKYDSENFLHGEYLDAALRNDALLHAVVGFSAFQRSLTNPTGKILDFLQYYNKAVSLLLESLRRGKLHTMGTLLTVLQLATIEEYLGDWINLLGHQKAAFEILTQLYNPRTIMQTHLSREVLVWYSRFDVFAGLMGGFETVLSTEWFVGARDHFEAKNKAEPENLGWIIESAFANQKLLAVEMSILLAKMGKGEITQENFLVENAQISERIEAWRIDLDPALQDPQWQATDFSGCPPLPQDDIVDPYVPGILYQGPLWPVNNMMIDYYTMSMMHKYQTSLVLHQVPGEELCRLAFACCQLFEAIQYWPSSPKGSIVASQASVSLSSLFLPNDERHHMWCRRKLALLEAHGYIFPLTFRTKMAALFQDPSCMQWWLPHDESCPPIVRTIRNFVQERTAPARDQSTEDLRDMKAMFSSMRVESSTSPSLSTSPEGSSSYGEETVLRFSSIAGESEWDDKKRGWEGGVWEHKPSERY